MGPADVLEVSREAVVVMLKISAPLLGLTLVVGLCISLFQALTQIQEMTLSFVPKILVMFVSLLVLMPVMYSTLDIFAQSLHCLIDLYFGTIDLHRGGRIFGQLAGNCRNHVIEVLNHCSKIALTFYRLSDDFA